MAITRQHLTDNRITNLNRSTTPNNGLSTLSQVTGIDKDELLKIAAEVKANHAKLHSCAYHEFEPLGESTGLAIRRKYQCKHCAGIIDQSAYGWHEAGRRPPAPATS